MKNKACAEQPKACSVQAKNPSRDLPIAILGSLSVATILYILMALAITLMVRALPCAMSLLKSATTLHYYSKSMRSDQCLLQVTESHWTRLQDGWIAKTLPK